VGERGSVGHFFGSAHSLKSEEYLLSAVGDRDFEGFSKEQTVFLGFFFSGFSKRRFFLAHFSLCEGVELGLTFGVGRDPTPDPSSRTPGR
jgi:hypothetical protein